MATVHDIVSFLGTIAPESWKESWDNVGLLCGRMGQPVTKILVALDPFPSVIHEAVTENADLIVTHHPLIFGNALMNVTDCTETGKSLLTLIEHNIAAVNAHTNLDMAPGGVNDVLAQTLGLEDITVPFPSGLNADGQSYGLLRTGTVASQSLDSFLSQVKDRLWWSECMGSNTLLRRKDHGQIKALVSYAMNNHSFAEEFNIIISKGTSSALE